MSEFCTGAIVRRRGVLVQSVCSAGRVSEVRTAGMSVPEFARGGTRGGGGNQLALPSPLIFSCCVGGRLEGERV